ncbi:MAG TPA: hypothetical protein VKA84_02245 [Gemmatimonadaceae bacterium]|nr:hypothetical protein [Gemmatimonadaceae bacterium]
MTAAALAGSPAGNGGSGELGFAELPGAVTSPFVTLPPEVLYRREKERRARTGADAVSSAMEEARREFAAMLAADRPKGTGGRPAKNGRGRPAAAATAQPVSDEVEGDHESPDVEELTLASVVGDADEGEIEAVEPEVDETHEVEDVEVVTAAEPAPRRTRGGRPAKTPAAAAPVRGKAATAGSSRNGSGSAPAAGRRRQPTRAAAPARSRRGSGSGKATSASGSSTRRGSSARAGTRGKR